MPDVFRPLAGRRVVSIAQQLPGPYCGLLLADLGAEVILIEQVAGGDLAARLDVDQKDEVGQLAEALRRMIAAHEQTGAGEGREESSRKRQGGR